MLGPDLFGHCEPPEVWLTLGVVDPSPVTDNRPVTLRLKPAGARSISTTSLVSRYAVEEEVFRAASETFRSLRCFQKCPSAAELERLFAGSLVRYVEPF